MEDPASDLKVLCEELCDCLRTQLVARDVPFDENTPFAKVGLDSLSLMELLLFIERRFGIEVPESDLTRANLRSVMTLAQCVQKLAVAKTAVGWKAEER